MTSTTDEITNLRYSLDHIRAWCAHEVKNGNLSPEASAICDTVRAMAMLGLKTPRASKVVPIRAPRPVVKADPGTPDPDDGYGPKGRGYCKGGCVP